MQSVRGAQRKRNGSMREGRSGGINQDWWSRRLGLRKDIWTRIERVSCQLGEEWSMEHSGQRQQPIRRWARDAFMWSNTHTHVCTHADTHTCTAVELEHRGRKGAELADWRGIWSQVFRSSDQGPVKRQARRQAGLGAIRSHRKEEEGRGAKAKGRAQFGNPTAGALPAPQPLPWNAVMRVNLQEWPAPRPPNPHQHAFLSGLYFDAFKENSNHLCISII